jgi:hypothetical protein
MRRPELTPEIQTAFRTLDVAEGSSPREIKQAFRRNMLEHHADRVEGDKHGGREFTAAFHLLKDNGYLDEPVDATQAVSGEQLFGVQKVLFYWNTTPVVYAVPISENDVDDVYAHCSRTNDWKLLKYCASNATDLEVKKAAIDYLILNKRFAEAIEATNAHAAIVWSEEKQYLLSVFEMMFGHEGVISPDYFEDVNKHALCDMAEILLRDSNNLVLIRNILESAISRDERLQIAFRLSETEKADVIMEVLEKHQRWDDIVRILIATGVQLQGKRWFDGEGKEFRPSEAWRRIFAVLERNLTEIIAADDARVLKYIAMRASTVEYGMTAIEALASRQYYEEIELVGRYARDRIVLLTSEIAGVERDTAWLPHECGIAIGKYAVDVLLRYNQRDRLSSLSSNAEAEEIKEYTREKLG